ncbi:DMT family transporter [Acetobacter sp.]|uniref:DMT family transporter n=1 Tax=Acetobacter sp. TaxID=440 RepID=UPI0039EBFA46
MDAHPVVDGPSPASPPSSTVEQKSPLYGALLVALAAVMWSGGGLFVRALSGMDIWVVVAWRSLFATLILLPLSFVLYGRTLFRIRESIGIGGLIVVPFLSISMLCYVASLNATTVANVMVMYSTTPLLAMALAFLILKEVPEKAALCAALVALSGVAIMALSSMSSAGLAGDGLAFIMTLTFAASIVVSRRWPRYNTPFVTGIASAFCSLACFAIALFHSSGTLLPTSAELCMLAAFGVLTQAFCFLLFLLGSRYIPPSEAGLITLLDVVLGPFWVWLAFGEQPEGVAILGGAMVLLAVAGYLIVSGRRKKRVSIPLGGACPETAT